ncbi:hypothetical protein BGZ65_006165 [Modicella reniformis]|uniref:Rho-GAP domain-containing protein n=1 Tax=Modicella reniformis TaxID=1440133 RepID=A0A9P6LS49_9FUNG|nr:hypothetical protein BGZ65_006165 [Modicella reniformis]
MGGIAGGIADRWKRRGDGMNDGSPDYPRYGSAAGGGGGGGGRVFGLPLEDAVRISKISASTGVPAVVTRCIEYLDIMGVEEVGLYRVPGSTSNVNRLKAIFDSGHDYDFLQKGNEPQNPHDVGTLLKLYLRELPSPIIPTDTMPSFNNIDFTDHLDQQQQQQPPVQQRLKEALRRHLPLENYILLGTLCQHLSNLADYENCTKMNISNLGLIFCPTLHIGSVLFKHLLGGDGSEQERRKSLLIVWEDLEKRREEMENIEMIKDFEMGDGGSSNSSSSSSSDINSSNRRIQLENKNGSLQNGGSSFGQVHKVEQQQQQQQQQSFDHGSSQRQSWEQIDRDLLDFSSSSPLSSPSSPTTLPPAPLPPLLLSSTTTTTIPTSTTPNLSQYTINNKPKPTTTTTTTITTEPPLDLYDELMAREINEATSTPLIDFHTSVFGHSDGGKEDDDDDDLPVKNNLLWRRHAREPAMNRRSDSPPPSPIRGVVSKHERLPAVSIR